LCILEGVKDFMGAYGDTAQFALELSDGPDRRAEAAALAVETLQQREEHWVIADLVGKGGHVRTVPVPICPRDHWWCPRRPHDPRHCAAREIRQSVQYTLARRVLWLIRAAMFTLAMKIFVEVSRDERGFSVNQVALLALGAALLLLQRRYRNRVQRWVDKRFFREAYKTEQVLSDLSNEARKFVDARPLLATVTHRIRETLHVPRISVLLRGAGGYRLESDGAATLAPVFLASQAHSIEHLRSVRSPVTVYFDDPDAWLRATPPSERRALQQLDVQLLLPLTGRDDLIGVMALGPKRSEEPYSKADLQLLQSVADQTGLAIENSRLISSLAEEAARRERFNRELEIAREVQERLFPQSYPSIKGLDCAGHCRPALGVGGDYYDFISWSCGKSCRHLTNAQCVVALWPSSNPARASNNAPSQTEHTHLAPAATFRK
jgi:GAF domain-containing protein